MTAVAMQDDSLSEHWENLGRSSSTSLHGNEEDNVMDLSFLTVAADPLTPPRVNKEKVQMQDILESPLFPALVTSTWNTPDSAPSKPELPTTTYEQVTYRGATGSLVLTKDRIVFHPSSSASPSSWRYKAIQKHQICQGDNHHLLKLVSVQGDNKAVVFAFDHRDELERSRKDIANRLKRQKKQGHGSTTTVCDNTPPTAAQVNLQHEQEGKFHPMDQDDDAVTTATTVTTGFPSSGDLIVVDHEALKEEPKMVLVDPISEPSKPDTNDGNNCDPVKVPPTEPSVVPLDSDSIYQDLVDPLDRPKEKTDCAWFRFRLFC
jgi:TFIIH p62 subunit, N-terminal domain